MPFPSAPLFFASEISTASTSHTFTVNSPTEGLPLLLFVRFPSAPGVRTWPDGFTELLALTGDPSDDMTCYAYKVADGTEGNSVVLTTQNSVKHCGGAIKINEMAYTEVLTDCTTGEGASPLAYFAHTPADGTQQYLWIWFGSRSGENATTALPDNFNDLGAVDTGLSGAGSTNCIGRFGYAQVEASSLTPSGTPVNLETAILLSIYPTQPMPYVGGGYYHS